jgi:capsular polysaccharide biosynthesis protein
LKNEENFNVKEFMNVIKRRKLIIVFAILISISSASLVSFYLIKPNYIVNTSIIVGKTKGISGENDQLQYDNILLYQNILKTYSEIVMSNTVAQSASEKLDFTLGSSQIQRLIKVTPKDNTQILIISARGDSRDKALNLLNAVSKSFTEEALKIFPTVNVDIFDKGELSFSTNTNSKTLIFCVILFIGIMTTIGSIFLAEYFDRTIKSENDVENYLELKVIGSIPKYK